MKQKNKNLTNCTKVPSCRLSRGQVALLVDFILADYTDTDYYWDNFEKMTIWAGNSQAQITRTEVSFALVCGGISRVRNLIKKRFREIKDEKDRFRIFRGIFTGDTKIRNCAWPK